MSVTFDRNDKLGAYEIIRPLGQGGMGTVYLGRSPDGRRVAIKVIRGDLSHDDEFRRRFRSEVNRARQVPPFCTAEVIDADPDHEPPYLVVEYVDGPTLSEAVREQGPLAGSALHGVAVATATALAAIHGAGVVHRDFKPANVLLAVGGVKVIDFGIARPFEVTSAHTRTDQMVGTIEYMAPERLDDTIGFPVGTPSDVFAWGAVMSYAATGRTPFSAGSAPATAIRILTGEPELSGMSGQLRDLVARTLSKDPRSRPSAQELLNVLVTGSAEITPAGGYTPSPPVPLSPSAPLSPPVPLSPPASLAAPVSPYVPYAAPAYVPGQPIPMGPSPFTTTGMTKASPRRTPWVIMAALIGTLLTCIIGAVVEFRDTPDGTQGAVEPFDSASSASPSTSPSTSASAKPSASTDTLKGFFAGKRKALIYVPEADRYVTLPFREDATLSDGTDDQAVYTLFPIGGTTYMLESVSKASDGSERCVGVHLVDDTATSLRAGECSSTKTMLFDITSTGQHDAKGRPTYLITSDFYGEIRWDTKTLRLSVGSKDSSAPRTAFSFIDQGAR